MVDLSLCNNDKCPSKETCLRWAYWQTRNGTQYQSWLVAEVDDTGKCELYWQWPGGDV